MFIQHAEKEKIVKIGLQQGEISVDYASLRIKVLASLYPRWVAPIVGQRAMTCGLIRAVSILETIYILIFIDTIYTIYRNHGHNE
jgi:hypothetical protein